MERTHTNRITGGFGIILLTLTVGLASYRVPAPQRESLDFLHVEKDTRAVDARLEAMMKKLHAKLDRLSERQNRLNQKVAAINDGQSGGAASVFEGEQVPSLTPEEADTRAEQRLAEQKYVMAAVLEAEDRDPHWSAAAQQVLYESFGLEGAPGIHVVDVTCRSSLCGAEFAFDGSVPHQATYRNMLDSVPWSGQRYVEMSMDADDPYIFMYIAREGHHLPELTGSMG